MVYRKKALTKIFENKDNIVFLKSYGYDENSDLKGHIQKLKSRLKNDEFPHEIGIFLGYPLHDIYGYLYNPGDECILCGEWKVYYNAEDAKKLFKRFNDCRCALLKKLMCGKTLIQVFSV